MEPDRIDASVLLSHIAQGDPSALSQLYDRYARVIYSLAYKSLRSVEDSEEVVLDVLAQIWRIAERFDPQRGRAETWIFTLTRSRILDRLRKVRRSGCAPLAVTEIQRAIGDVDLWEEAIHRERRGQIRRALQSLPPEQKHAIDLAYFQGLSQSEIVAQTGWPLGTVKTRLRLGLSKLQHFLHGFSQ